MSYESIKRKGYLEPGDSVSYMIDIVNLFSNRNYTKPSKWARCTFPYNPVGCFKHQRYTWSPELSVNGSDKNGWRNLLSADHQFITEKVVEAANRKSKSEFDSLVRNGIERITFMSYKNECKREFLGVYKAYKYNEEDGSIVWKLDRTTIQLENLDK